MKSWIDCLWREFWKELSTKNPTNIITTRTNKEEEGRCFLEKRVGRVCRGFGGGNRTTFFGCAVIKRPRRGMTQDLWQHLLPSQYRSRIVPIIITSYYCIPRRWWTSRPKTSLLISVLKNQSTYNFTQKGIIKPRNNGSPRLWICWPRTCSNGERQDFGSVS